MFHWVFIFTLIFVSYFGLSSFFSSPYLPLFHDQYQSERTFAMTRAIAFGQLPPRVVDGFGFGFGYPLYNFYAPLPYFISAFFSLLGINTLLSTKLMIALGFISAFFTMYYVVSRYLSKQSALIAALLYTLSPYHAVQLYVRGSIGELYAYTLLPFAIAFLIELFQDNKKISVPIIVGMSFLFISHTVSLYITVITISLGVVTWAIYTLFKSQKSKERKELFTIGAKKTIYYFIMPLLLTAYFSLPAFVEVPQTRLSISGGNDVNYKDHFITLAQVWDSPWGYAGSSATQDGMTFMLGKVSILLTTLVVLLRLFNKSNKQSNNVLFNLSAIMLAISLLMMTPASLLLWQTLPLANLIQFPWRFLIFSNISVATISALIWPSLTIYIERFQIIRHEKVLFAAIIIIIGYALIFPINPAGIGQNKFFKAKAFYEKDSQEIQDYKHISGEVSQVSYEYINPDIDIQQAKGGYPGVNCTTLCRIRNENSTPDRLSFTVTTSSSGYITIPRAHFPGYKVFIDNIQKELVIKDGLMSVLIPSEGKFEVNFQLLDSPIRAISNIIAFTSLMGIIIFMQIRSLPNLSNRKRCTTHGA